MSGIGIPPPVGGITKEGWQFHDELAHATGAASVGYQTVGFSLWDPNELIWEHCEPHTWNLSPSVHSQIIPVHKAKCETRLLCDKDGGRTTNSRLLGERAREVVSSYCNYHIGQCRWATNRSRRTAFRKVWPSVFFDLKQKKIKTIWFVKIWKSSHEGKNQKMLGFFRKCIEKWKKTRFWDVKYSKISPAARKNGLFQRHFDSKPVQNRPRRGRNFLGSNIFWSVKNK